MPSEYRVNRKQVEQAGHSVDQRHTKKYFNSTALIHSWLQEIWVFFAHYQNIHQQFKELIIPELFNPSSQVACRNQYIAHHLWVGLPGCSLIYSTNREVKEFDVWCQLDKVILNDWEPKHWVHRVVRAGHMWVGQKNKICQRKFWLRTISIQQNSFSIPWRIIRQNHWVLLTITRTPRHYWLSLLLLEWPVQCDNHSSFN